MLAIIPYFPLKIGNLLTKGYNSKNSEHKRTAISLVETLRLYYEREEYLINLSLLYTTSNNQAPIRVTIIPNEHIIFKTLPDNVWRIQFGDGKSFQRTCNQPERESWDLADLFDYLEKRYEQIGGFLKNEH